MRFALGSAVALVFGVALPACTDRDEPAAAAFTKAEGQLLVRAKNIKWGAAPSDMPAGAKAALL